MQLVLVFKQISEKDYRASTVKAVKDREANPAGEKSSFILQLMSNIYHLIILSLPM